MQLKRLFAAAILASAALAATSASASAQTQACAEEDLRCRVTALEAQLNDLTRRLERPRENGSASTPLATLFTLRRPCRTDCASEAANACIERGFAAGRAEDWERPRSGPVTLTRVTCTR